LVKEQRMNEDKPNAKGEARTATSTVTQDGSLADTMKKHPVGTTVGGAGGLVAGAVLGTAAGPLGTVVGGIAGAVAGALAGAGTGELIDPEAEDAYWAEHYDERPYVQGNASYDDYRPAYRAGVQAYVEHSQQNWDAVEPELQASWDQSRDNSRLTWLEARDAARDAWERVSGKVERLPGDASADRQ
jgi:phage tail tape-measure protein